LDGGAGFDFQVVSEACSVVIDYQDLHGDYFSLLKRLLIEK
jgi:hypothetical protein